MNKRLVKYFIFGGIASALILAIPAIIIFVIVFPPLFIFLALFPSIYLYSLALALFLFITKPFGILRWILSLAMLAVLAFGIPYHFNQATFEQVKEITKDDKEINSPLEGYDTIAFIDTRGYINFGNGDLCQPLCQRLLYGGSFKNVVSAHSLNDTGALKFYIEKGGNCPVVANAIESVSARIAKGECLLRKKVSLDSENIDIIYELSRAESATHILTEKIQVLKKQDNDTVVLHQITQVKAFPLFYPFYIGPIDGYQLHVRTGLGRSRYILNDFDKIVKNESIKIFGKAVMEPENKNQEDKLSPENRALIIGAFNSKDPDKQQGHFLFEQYIMGFWQGDKKPAKEDVDLVIMALKDDREDKFDYLDSFIHKLDNIPDELIQELANRIIRTGKSGTSDAIRNLPEKRAAVIYPQLEKMTDDEHLRYVAWPAITRLGDGGEKALPHYMAVLKEYENRDLEDLSYQTLAGTLIGLCYMGEAALPAKETLLSMIRLPVPGAKNQKKSFNITILAALIQMGVTEELTEKFKNNENILQEIKTITGKNNYYSHKPNPKIFPKTKYCNRH